MSLVKEYLLVGGMPAAVSSWVNSGSLEEINQIHYDLLATYREDRGRLSNDRLEDVLTAVPYQLGKKFFFSCKQTGEHLLNETSS